MSMLKQCECFHCDAIFKVKNSNDQSVQDQYVVYYCPYCGGDIEEEHEEELDDDE